jgi:hypothetical protein
MIMSENIILTNAQIDKMAPILSFKGQQLQNQALLSAIKKKMDGKAAYWVARVLDKAVGIYTTYQKERQEAIQDGAELDDKGNIRLDEGGGVTWKSKEAQDATVKRIEDLRLAENDMGIRLIKLTWKDNEGKPREYTPEEMGILSLLIEPPPED